MLAHVLLGVGAELSKFKNSFALSADKKHTEHQMLAAGAGLQLSSHFPRASPAGLLQDMKKMLRACLEVSFL